MPFLKIADSDQVPAEGARTFEVEGTKVAVFRHGGKLCALADTCPHQGGPLSEGSVKDGKVICPWHRWTFDLETGACENQEGTRAESYPIKEEDGGLLVDVASPRSAAPQAPAAAPQEAREVKPGTGLRFLSKNRNDAIKDLLGFLGKSGANLEPKTKFLIYLALQTQNFSPRGLRQYIPKAIAAGASEDEVLDAILQAYPGGGLANVVDAVDIFLSLGYGGELPT